MAGANKAPARRTAANSAMAAPYGNAQQDDAYGSLRAILDEAYNQAAHGKGAERHANEQAFDDQPIHLIGGMVGIGFNAGQAMKKTQEAVSMANRGEGDRAVHEMLGAIVYLASTINLVRRSEA